MLLGIVSDTHGHVPLTLDAVRLLESLGVEQVLHCGDIGSPAIPALFQAWPTHYVFGNVDLGDEEELRAAIEKAGGTCWERFGRIELAGKPVALLHSDDAARFRETIASGEYDLVCYGHTHQADWRQAGRTWLLNPGALYRANPRSFALLDWPKGEMTSIRVSR